MRIRQGLLEAGPDNRKPHRKNNKRFNINLKSFENRRGDPLEGFGDQTRHARDVYNGPAALQVRDRILNSQESAAEFGSSSCSPSLRCCRVRSRRPSSNMDLLYLEAL
jgi:hypothetical protein